MADSLSPIMSWVKMVGRGVLGYTTWRVPACWGGSTQKARGVLAAWGALLGGSAGAGALTSPLPSRLNHRR